jgi:hypothetical protein
MAGHLNTKADSLSRKTILLHKWTLPLKTFNKIQEQWKFHRLTIDAFAAHHNHRLAHYWSYYRIRERWRSMHLHSNGRNRVYI